MANALCGQVRYGFRFPVKSRLLYLEATGFTENRAHYRYGDDVPTGVVLDSHDNIYICGYTYGGKASTGGTAYDWLTLKYNASGHLLWKRIYNGTANKDEQANAITLDSQGNVIVVGTTTDTDINDNVVVSYGIIKCGSDGHLIWGDHYLIGPSGSANAVAVDSHDNVIVTGGMAQGFGFYNTVNLKLDPNGALLWSDLHKYAGSGTAIVVNANDDIYIGGMTDGGTDIYGESVKWRLYHYQADGTLVWSYGTDKYGPLSGIALDSADNFYAAGIFNDRWDTNKPPVYFRTTKFAP